MARADGTKVIARNAAPKRRPIDEEGRFTGEGVTGLTFERRWTTPGVHPYDEVTWELRSAEIKNESGGTVFEQNDIEVPSFWSQLATNVVVSKYFRGHIGTPGRERSVKQLIDRVVNTICGWAATQHYFASDEDLATFKAELTHLLLHQKMAFNSPVWFNVGVEEKPQCSACFINSVQDNMGSIMDLAKTEAMLFKYGSGAGVNLSPIRGSKERLSRGGIASGPVSFMKGFDAFAGVVKSGGTTRRAAKMVILNADHPDIVEFIDSKANEEKKAWALIEQGYDASFTGEAYGSVFFQNANHSVRVTDEFMRAVENDADWKTREVITGEPVDTHRARELLRKMAEAAWICGDPGIQYDTTINDWHTSANTDRIYASNPCCFVGETLVDTVAGLLPIAELERMDRDGRSLPATYSHDRSTGGTVVRQINRAWVAGYTNELVEVRTELGRTLRCTPEHRFLTFDGRYVEAQDLVPGTSLRKIYREEAAPVRFPAPGDSNATRQPALAVTNDKVVSVNRVYLANAIPVFDLEVDGTHNFGVSDSNDPSVRSIVVSNSEYMFLNDTACFAPQTRISTPNGLRTVLELFEAQQLGEQVIVTTDIRGEHDHRRLTAHRPAHVTEVGERPVFKMRLSDGRQIRTTADHRFLTADGTWKELQELEPGVDRIAIRESGNPVAFLSSEADVRRWRMLGWMTGDGVFSKDIAALVFGPTERATADWMELEFQGLVAEARAREQAVESVEVEVSREALLTAEGVFTPNRARVAHVSSHANGVLQISSKSGALVRLLEDQYGFKQGTAIYKDVPTELHRVADDLKVAYLQGLFSADGSIRQAAAATEPEIMLASSSPELLRSVQLLLSDLGITSRISWMHPTGRKNPQGQLHIYNEQARTFLALIGFPCSETKSTRAAQVLGSAFAGAHKNPRAAKVVSIDPGGIETVYDITEPATHSVIAEGLVAHNCNLASLNLMKFVRDDGEFDAEAYRFAARVTITAQEILVDNASYPTPQIELNSHLFRPLGLGYANLGALLMSRGLAYDSDAGQAYAATLTAIMTGEAYAQSAVVAGNHGGPFAEYKKNEQPFIRVIKKHRDAAYAIPEQDAPRELIDAARSTWDSALELGTQHGYRNAQVTVLAPTGCLVGGSMVITDRGLVRLRSLGNPDGDKWQQLDLKVGTDDGPRQATKFFVNGAEPVVSVKTRRGYRIQGTTMHRIKVVDASGDWQWRRFSDVRAGDRVPLMLGGLIGKPREVPLPPLAEAYWTSDHTTFVPRYMTPELAELVGYFMGDGSLHAKGLRFCVDSKDTDVVDRLSELGRRLFGLEAAIATKQGYTEVALHSVRLTLWWEACGFAKKAPTTTHRGKGYEAHIPDAVLYTNDPQAYRAFVRGLFEADGNVSNGYAYWSTVSEQFSHDVQSLLLALGYVMTRDVSTGAFGHMGANAVHRLRLLNVESAGRWLSEISFVSERKRELLAAMYSTVWQAAKADRVPVNRQTVALLPAKDNLRRAMELSLRRTGLVSRRSATALLERTQDPELAQSLDYFYDEVASAELGEEQLTYDISVPENVTYVANGFVSHNTIAFMMDCDTTGIEPDIALIKYKKLVGEGFLKIVNQTVPAALKKLGYSPEQVEDIVRYIDERETIEGAPSLKPEHLPVFDCAFKPVNGERSIHYMGHVRMMGATQPFLSGAISKTVNMPEAATAEEIADVYLEGWKLGLKAIAIYRDGSKRSQPLSTGKKKDKGAEEQVSAAAASVVAELAGEPKPYRRRLPDERRAITHKFQVSGHEGYITVGLYPDGQPGEIFLKMAKEGSTISGLMDSLATMTSISLQYGVPLRDLVSKFAHSRFEPAGFTGNQEIPIAKSIVDYVFRWMGSRFLPKDDRDALGIINRAEISGGQGLAVTGALGSVAGPSADASAPASDSRASDPGSTTALNPNSPTGSENAARPATPGQAAQQQTSSTSTDGAGAPSADADLPALSNGKGHAGNGRSVKPLELGGGTKVAFNVSADSPSCADCGSIMVRNGSCYKCLNCGSTSGCS